MKRIHGTGSNVRVALFDYTGDFDFIDQKNLFEKLIALDIPRGIFCCTIDFLKDRKVQARHHDCKIYWGDIPVGFYIYSSGREICVKY